MSAQTITTVTGGYMGDGEPAEKGRLAQPNSVAVDADGSMYIADTGHHRIRKVDGLTGVISTVAGSGKQGFAGDGGPASEAWLSGPHSVFLDGAGGLYIADTQNGRIRYVDLGTGIVSSVAGNGNSWEYSGDGGNALVAALGTVSGIHVTSDGDIYLADREGHRVRKIDATSGTITTVAGTGVKGYGGDDGPATDADLDGPTDVYVDQSGNLYIADQYNVRVRMVDNSGTITTVVGSGGFGMSGDGGPAIHATLLGPTGIHGDGAGKIYIADNTKVRKLDLATGIISTAAGEGGNGYTGDGGPASQARLDMASGVYAGPDGSVYIAALLNSAIRKVDPAGMMSTVAGGSLGDGGPAGEGDLYGPSDVTVGPGGVIYIADTFHARIRAVSADGVIRTIAGSGSLSHNGDGGPATEAAMSGALSVHVTASGDVYLVDTGNSAVRKVDGMTGVITTIVGARGHQYSGDGGPAVVASIYFPAGVFVDGAGNVYITCGGSHRIRRIDGETGIITTIAGSGVPGYGGDGGPATSADLNGPGGIYVDAAGSIFFTDNNNHRVRRIDGVSGIIATVAGTGTSGFTADNIPAVATSLNWPNDVWLDGGGNMYIADTDNQRIRRVDSGTGLIETVAGTGIAGFEGDGNLATEAALSRPLGVYVDAAGSIYIADFGNNRIRKVVSDNEAPVLTQIGAQSVQEGFELSLSLSATDGDGEAVSYSVRGAPDGAVLSGTSFTWVPTYTQQGEYTITFVATDESGGSDSEIVAITVADVLDLSPAGIDFGLVWVDSSASESVVIRNFGSTALEVSTELVSTEFSIGSLPASVAGQDRLQIEVVFGPLSEGAKTAELLVTVDGETMPVAISGTGRVPSLSVSADALDFGSATVGQVVSRILTISNAGDESFTVTNIVPGDPQYKVSSSSFSLSPGGARDITVTFTALEGRASSSTLTILSNDSETPVRLIDLIAVVGSLGEDPAAGIFPSSLNFGSVSLGQSKVVTLLISNDGGGTLRVLNIVASTGEVTVSETGFSLDAGEEQLLTVTLQPTQIGSFSEVLDLPTNDPEHPLLQVPLRATVESGGGLPSLSLSITQLSFGQVEVGATSEFLIPVSNVGSAMLTISNTASDNTQVVVSPTSVSVPPQETRSLMVLFRPLPGRERSGRVTLFSNDQLQPQVGLSWSAQEVTSPYLSVISQSPADGDFGVSTTTQLGLTFGEPLFHRRGFTALDVQLRPEPLSGPLMDVLDVRGDGRTVVFEVELGVDTVYRLVVFGATGQSGLELFDIVETTFTTGAAPAVLSTLSGTVGLDVEAVLTGSVYLFDIGGDLVSQANLGLDGSWEMPGIPEGEYTLFADGELSDGRGAGGSYDGDGAGDTLVVQAGVDQSGLAIAAQGRGVVTPPVTGIQFSVDLDGAAGDQGIDTGWETAAGDEAVLEVYVTGVEALSGSGVTVSYDSSQVYLRGFEPGDHVLMQGGGTTLFVSHVDPDVPSVELGGAIMGATETTAVSGGGLLGRFLFTAQDGFTGESVLTVSAALLRTLDGATKLEPLIEARLTSASPASFPVGPLSIDFNEAAGDQGLREGGGAVAGKRYSLELHIADAPEINGWGATIEYDATQVAYVSGSFEASDFLPGIFALPEEGPGVVTLGGTILGSDVSNSGNGLLCTLEFEVLAGFTGSTELVITQVQLKDVATGEQILAVRYAVTIIAGGGLAGDFTGDGKVNLSDFFLFADAFGGTDPRYDLTGDGRVNLSDFFVFADAFGSDVGKLLALAEAYLGVPLTPRLESNYPNPFNSETAISYWLPREGPVELVVFDLAGQQVRTLDRGFRAAGRHEVRWDARDDRGESVGSGVYLYQLRAAASQRTQKLLLLR